MRKTASILLALLALGGVWILLGDDDPAGPGDESEWDDDAGRDDDVPSGTGNGPMTVADSRGGVEVVPAGSWDLVVDEENPPPLPPTINDLEIRSPDGRDWQPTGAALLEILTERFPDLPLRFEDEATLAAFRGQTWPHPVPGVSHLGMVLQMMEEVGFRAVPADGALYLTRVEER